MRVAARRQKEAQMNRLVAPITVNAEITVNGTSVSGRDITVPRRCRSLPCRRRRRLVRRLRRRRRCGPRSARPPRPGCDPRLHGPPGAASAGGVRQVVPRKERETGPVGPAGCRRGILPRTVMALERFLSFGALAHLAFALIWPPSLAFHRLIPMFFRQGRGQAAQAFPCTAPRWHGDPRETRARLPPLLIDR